MGMFDIPRRVITSQTVAYTGTSAAATNAFGSQTYCLRLCATSDCVYKVGDGTQTAVDDSTGVYLPAKWESFIQVNPGQRIAVIQKATNGLVTGTAGTLWVSEMAN